LVLGGIALTYDWNFPLGKREFERAIALDPNSAVAHRLYGWYLARAERNYVAARQEMATARRLDPLNTWPWWGEWGVDIAQGDYEGAIATPDSPHHGHVLSGSSRRAVAIS